MENVREERIWGDFVLRIPSKVSSYNPKSKKAEMVDNTINRNYHQSQNFTTVKTKVMTVEPFAITDKKLEDLKAGGKSEVYISELKKFQNKNVYLDFESSLVKNLEKITNNEIQVGDTILVNGYMHAERGKSEANKDTVYFKIATASDKKDEKGKIITGSNPQAEIKKIYSSTFFYKDSSNSFEEKKKEIEKGFHQNITVVISKMDKETGLKYENSSKDGAFKGNENSSYFKMKDGVYYLNAKSLDRPIKKVDGDKTYFNPVTIPVIAKGLESTPLINQIDSLSGTITLTGKGCIQSYTDKNGETKEYLALDITGGSKEKTYTLCKNAYQIACLRAETISKAFENDIPTKGIEAKPSRIKPVENDIDFDI